MTTAISRSILATLPRLGELMPDHGGHFGALMRAPEYDYLLIVSDDPRASMEDVSYGKYVDHKADSLWDGEANTQAMAENGSELGQKIIELGGGLYLPARLETMALCASVKHLYDPKWYLTSTQCGPDGAYVQFFVDGYTIDFAKDDKARVRLVRRLILQ